MLYFYYGQKSHSDIDDARALVRSLSERKPDASVFEHDADNFKMHSGEEYLNSQGLFENKYIIFLNRISESDEGNTFLTDSAERMSQSKNIFIVYEDSAGVTTRKALETHSTKSQVAKKTSSADRRRDFNIFSITEALGSRSNKKLWTLYREALMKGVEPEEIHSMLFWQTKAMLLSSSARSANDTGLKPFVYSKSRRHSENYNPQELRALSNSLVELYHNARRGAVDLDVGLEQFILSL